MANAKEPLSHLLFADDTLIFSRAKEEDCVEMWNILQSYERASNQAINMSKSVVSLIRNVEEAMKIAITNILGLDPSLPHDKYLGLPIWVGRNKRSTFQCIKYREWRKLQLWKGKFFSIGGREILIKVVATTIPTYTMGILVKDIQGLIARYWWGGDDASQSGMLT